MDELDVELAGDLGGREARVLGLAEVKVACRAGSIWQARGATSRRRIKFEDRATCYHLMSRTNNSEFLFGPTEKEAFRRMMWMLSGFLGVEVLTFVVMDNHFHVLAKVPHREKWLRRFAGEKGEERLLEHLRKVYSKKYLEQLRREIEGYRSQGNERAVDELKERFMARFCDVSVFMKELKERFSRWFNRQKGRRGTLWMERFKSVLVDGEAALATMAAYIDLNPVRAGIVDDPADYEWSGFGEASAGRRRAKRGISKALNHPQDLWEERSLPRYRVYLYDQGVEVSDERAPSGKRRRGVSAAARREVLRERKAAFSNGVAMGGAAFVQGVALTYQEKMARQRPRKPREVGRNAGWFVMRE